MTPKEIQTWRGKSINTMTALTARKALKEAILVANDIHTRHLAFVKQVADRLEDVSEEIKEEEG